MSRSSPEPTRLTRRRWTTAAALLALAVAATGVVPGQAPAGATFAGANGLIACQSARDGNMEIYVMAPDGSGREVNLTQNPAEDGGPVWSPDGTKIAFHSARDGDLDIHVMNADGTGVTQLTNEPGLDLFPTWSPDGTQIAFGTNRHASGPDGHGPGQVEIYVMDADGSNQQRLTFEDAQDALPDWSPDGSVIAFNTNREQDNPVPDHPQETFVYVMAPDGTNPTRLSDGPGIDAGPSFSPDGSRIIFHGNRDGELDLFVMNADGSDETNITPGAGNAVFGAWSPDGTKVVFNSTRANATNADVYVMNLDGSGLTRLTKAKGFDGICDWQVATPIPTPDSADDCKNNRWWLYADETGQRFTSQGLCKTFVETHQP